MTETTTTLNWQHVQNAVIVKLQSLPKVNAEIVLPNNPPKKRTGLFVELTVSPTGSFPWTDHTMLHLGSIDQIVNVPDGEGTDRAFDIAAMIAGMYSPIESSKAGFQAGPYWVNVRGVRQMPSDRQNELFRINIRVEIEIYIP